jgi:hypothetical protein
VTPTYKKKKNREKMKSKGEISFNHLIPIELFREIHLFSNDRDYYRLITSMKCFSEVKFQTRKIRLKDEVAARFLEDREFHQLILSKLANPVMQLSIRLISFPEEVSARDVLSSTPMQRLQILPRGLKQIHMMRRQPEFADPTVWELILKNKQNIHISEAIFVTIFPHLPYTHSLHIYANYELTHLSSLSHMKKVSLSYCGLISNVSCLKNVEYLRIHNCEGVVDVGALGNIHRLEIIGCSQITDVSALTNNAYLCLSYCTGLWKFPTHFYGFQFFVDDPTIVLKNMICPNLKYYELLQVKVMEEAEGQLLRGLHLQFLNLFSVKIDSCGEIQSLDGLKKVPVVFVRCCGALKEISGLGENKSVHIELCWRITSFLSLKNVPKVTISDCSEFIRGHDVENVKKLTLRQLPNFNDAKMLGNVRQLKIIQCSQVNSFEGLSNVNDLELSCEFSELRHLGGSEQKRIVLQNLNRDYFERNGSLLSIYSDFDTFQNGLSLVFLRKQQKLVTTSVPAKSHSKRSKCSIM